MKEKVYRKIKVYGDYFWEFYNKQNEQVQLKIDWTIDLIKTTKYVPQKFFKKLINAEDLWEIRVRTGKGTFRIFCFFDGGNLIILTTGFQKKTQKTPKKELQRAIKIKQDYYENKG